MLKFDIRGNLIEGIHWLTWQELGSNFGFTWGRQRFLKKMEMGLKSLRQAGCQAVYIGGSFVTRKSIPDDFDICYDDSAVDVDLLAAIDPTILSLDNSRAAQKAKYDGEFLPLSREYGPGVSYLDLFQGDEDTGDPKGIVGLKLTTIEFNYDYLDLLDFRFGSLPVNWPRIK
ncbi:DUF6932 family protein [Spirosoma radiotolerans]|uniref:DUF6932 family protein n=1 Tax=Spirosoma radiotolerans TaxID=1379870 RepID=UPI000697E1D4|nr:hypothetical protein [Spirosoma radiotolerans]